MIRKDFTPNKILATNKNNAQHNEIQTRLKVAAKTNALHFNQLNIDVVLPEVLKIRIIITNKGVQNDKFNQIRLKLQ